MLLAETYAAETPLQYPSVTFRPNSLLEAARALFQAMYVDIFTSGCDCAPTIPKGMALAMRNYINGNSDVGIRDALREAGSGWTTRALMMIAMRSGLYDESAFTRSLSQWVIAAYGDTFTSDMNDFSLIAFNEFGDLYQSPPGVGLPEKISASLQGLTNNTPMTPFYRWLAVITRAVLEKDPTDINLIFEGLLPLMAPPLDPVLTMTRASRIPLSSFVSILTHIQDLYPNNQNNRVCSYDIMRSCAWNRFYAFGHRRFLLSDPKSAQQYFDTYIAPLPIPCLEKCPTLSTVLALINTLASVNTPNAVPGLRNAIEAGPESRTRIIISLEAAELISEQSVDDDGDGTSADDGNATDPTTGPIPNSTNDRSDEEDGNDPMAIAMAKGKSVNNNPIGETSSGSKLTDAVTPVDETGITPGQKGMDYLYRMAVNTLNTRLREEPDFDVPASSRDSLERWCRYWLWIRPVEYTRDLMKELGLQPLLSPLD